MDLYHLTVPIYIRTLHNLKHILEIGEKFANDHGLEHSTLLDARLAPDMKPLTFQIQSASSTAKRSITMITTIEGPVMEDDEKTFDELYARIDKTIEFLKALPRDVLKDKEQAETTIPRGEVKLTGLQFTQILALPNFFFHVSMAYAILRKEGVALGKDDYLAEGSLSNLKGLEQETSS